MERQVLERYLRQGLAIEKIASLTGRHPSTVGYWLKRHGLAAVHRDRHAPKGGISRERLEQLVEEGLSTRGIAEGLGLSQATVRHWLRRHGLKTRASTRPPAATGIRGHDPDRRVMSCADHGATEFWLEGRGIYRCLRCRSEAVSRRRRRLKEILVSEAGGRCRLCGYDRHVGALQFHHRDSKKKSFGLAERGFTRSLEVVRAEAAKCILVCSNCHAELEAGIVSLE